MVVQADCLSSIINIALYVLSAFLKAFAIIFLTAEFDKSLGVDQILFSCLVISDLLEIFDNLLVNCLRNAWFSLSFFTSHF